MSKQSIVYFRQANQEELQEFRFHGSAYVPGSPNLSHIKNVFAGNNVVEWICPTDDGCIHYKKMSKEEVLETYGGVLTSAQVDEILKM